MRLTFETLPAQNDPTVLTKAEIAEQLARVVDCWAIVARHDRYARAEAHAARVNDGREYGEGFEAEVRQIGSEHRVYARKAGA
jgi:hypothetical protein